MNLTTKLKETAFSVLPIMAIVLILGFTIAPISSVTMVRFVFGGLLLILGLTIFLLGVDIGILPIGERGGAALTAKRNLPLLLSAAFFIGFIVTIAEPDVQVLADQIKSVSPSVGKWTLIIMIAVGVGLFVMLGLLRSVLSWNLRTMLILLYTALFALAFLSPKGFQGIAFDAGGATTGPMTVPFIMALGMGVASVRSRGPGRKDSSSNDTSFGLTGIASIGPVAAVCIYGIIHAKKETVSEAVTVAEEIAVDALVHEGVPLRDKAWGLGIFAELLPDTIREVTIALLPLVILFAVFQIFLLKMPRGQLRRMILGLFYSFVGLVIFLTGTHGGFMPAGEELGKTLGALAFTGSAKWIVLLIIIGAIFGAVVVCAEPAVWVLTEQVEQESSGNIKRNVILTALSLGVALSIALSMARIFFNFSLWCLLLPGYAIALLLTLFCPPLFTGIAFDSGGVASGPMTSTFILSFTLGVAASTGGNSENAFGVIALVAMTPLIAIQILGIIFKLKSAKKMKGKQEKIPLK